ncbi:peptidoglycan/LPS O-acetylase OafA/YrhL [Rhizobium sp. BK661]|nr:peptidoglycan/LPS O-acetylase OafA/YrhL [Rhizobium sp. BK661]
MKDEIRDGLRGLAALSAFLRHIFVSPYTGINLAKGADILAGNERSRAD